MPEVVTALPPFHDEYSSFSSMDTSVLDDLDNDFWLSLLCKAKMKHHWGAFGV